MPSPREWGPHLWYALHAMAGAYPERPPGEVRRAAARLLIALTLLLPCPVCARNLRRDLREHRLWPATATRDAFERFVYDLHARVNTRDGRDVGPPFETVRRAFRPSAHGPSAWADAKARFEATIANHSTHDYQSRSHAHAHGSRARH